MQNLPLEFALIGLVVALPTCALLVVEYREAKKTDNDLSLLKFYFSQWKPSAGKRFASFGLGVLLAAILFNIF